MTGLPARFPVRAQMLSDWIVGTGEGRAGDVDATVRRDGDGLPFIPAKTLTGIWRDACEQVAAWLAPGARTSPWQAWVDWIFGSQPDVGTDLARLASRAPQPAALALSPARLTRSVRDACRGRPALLGAAVVVRPGVAINDETGVARDDMLRLEERAPPGTLEAHAGFPLLSSGDVPPQAEFLLRAGAALVDGLGGKRNRGAGRCWLLLPGMSVPSGEAPVPAAPRPPDERLAELAADTALLDDPGSPPPHHRSSPALTPPAAGVVHPGTASGGAGAVSASTTWRVTIEVITPLIAQHRVLGNIVLSRDFLSGSMLLPVVLARLSRPVGHRDVVVGDARPAVGTGDGVVAGVPAPMIWYRHKDRSRNDVVNAGMRRPDPAERLKPMSAGHIAPAGGGAWFMLAPEMSVSTHAVIHDDEGRPDASRGGVFSYLGIAPRTVLVSDVVLPKDVHLALSPGERLHLGRSRKDDFGEVEVRDVQALSPPHPAALTAGDQVQVWCVSEVLLRNEWGAFDPSPQSLARELSQRLYARMSVVPQEPGGPVVQACRASRRDSFQTRWDRPRPTLVGIAAGSVITLTTDQAVTGGALAEIQRNGIGERTTEGFGQVRLDAPELHAAEPTLITANGPRSAATPAPEAAAVLPAGTGEDLPAAPHILEEAAVKAEITRQVARTVMERADRVIPGASQVTSRAQWGSLREQLPRLRTPGGRRQVNHWLEQTQKVRQRRDAWGKAALEALTDLITDDAKVWIELSLDGTALDDFVLGPSRADAIRTALWSHAVSVLITEIARHATRRLQASAVAEARL